MKVDTDVAISKDWSGTGKIETRVAQLAMFKLKARISQTILTAILMENAVLDREDGITTIVKRACDIADKFYQECADRDWVIYLDEEGIER